jgi:hypothetical protein
MVQDSPVVRINFEMVLEKKEGKIIGYLYRLFIVEDSLIYNTVKVVARVSDNVLIVEDDESVSRNFEERANRKIKAAYFFKINPKNLNSDSLKGEWTTSCNDGCMQIHKPLFVKEFMHCKCNRMTYTKYRTKCIGAETQVCNFSQKFKAVFFGLKRIFFCIAVTQYFNSRCFEFHLLAFAQ